MGKVFGQEEVRLKMVPDLEKGFGLVSEHLRSRIGKFQGILAATLCGSFLYGKHSIRSDIDCVLIYSKESQAECISFFQDLIRFADTHHVPLELVATRSDIAITPYHTIQTAFLEHIDLCERKGGNIKGDVVSSFMNPYKAIREETIDYIISRIRKLEKGWVNLPTMGEEEYRRFLSKVLDAPMHIARRVCRAKNVDFGSDDSKSSVIKQYQQVVFSEEHAMLLEMIELDGFYTSELEGHLVDFRRSSYTGLLKKLENVIPVVLEFAYRNLQLF